MFLSVLIVGLRAIAKFATAALAKQKGINMELKVKGDNFDEEYKITKDNAIIWDTRIVKKIPNEIAVSGTGSGCVVVSVNRRRFVFLLSSRNLHGKEVAIEVN